MKRIFFIDDDIDDRELFQRALKLVNTETQYVEAIDGHDALEKIADKDFILPDLIFVDLNMPRVNGLEFIIRIKQMLHYQDIPTYVYTTSASPRERVNCMSAGASGYIVKPYNESQLGKELNEIILKHKMAS